MEDTPFHIRPYGKSQLALFYNPHLTPAAARRKLLQWIHYYPGLEENLRRLDFSDKQRRSYSTAQVRLIVEALGEP